MFRSEAEFPIYLYWSPDGSQISFLTQPEGEQTLAMYIADDQENGKSLLVDTGQPYYWVWSPQGKQIFVHAGGSAQDNPENAHLLYLLLDEGVEKNSLEMAPAFFQDPAFFPDGTSILVAAEITHNEKGLVLADAAGNSFPRASAKGDLAFWSWK